MQDIQQTRKLNTKKLTKILTHPHEIFDKLRPNESQNEEWHMIMVADSSSSMGKQVEPVAEIITNIADSIDNIKNSYIPPVFITEFQLLHIPVSVGFNKFINRTIFNKSITETEEIELLDLKVSSTWMGSKAEFNDLELFQFKIDQLQNKNPTKLIAGGYCEPRPLYTSSAYDKEGNNGPESRTFHLGIDFWLAEGTPVHAIFDGEIFTATNDAGFKEYGGLIILKHNENNLTFYTLHGHLSVASVKAFKIGDKVRKGDCLGHLGSPEENGVWASHLHFQLMLSMLDFSLDFPGVTYANQLKVWKSI